MFDHRRLEDLQIKRGRASLGMTRGGDNRFVDEDKAREGNLKWTAKGEMNLDLVLAALLAPLF